MVERLDRDYFEKSFRKKLDDTSQLVAGYLTLPQLFQSIEDGMKGDSQHGHNDENSRYRGCQ